MMHAVITLTRRRDPRAEHHYRAFDGDRYVGRIYQVDTDRWFWGLAYDMTAPAMPPYGWHEPTRQAAMEKLKVAYLGCRSDSRL